VQGFRKCCICNAVDKTDDGMLWNDSEEDGNGGSECEQERGTAVKLETVTLIGKGR
jgi:hypothetical protein